MEEKHYARFASPNEETGNVTLLDLVWRKGHPALHGTETGLGGDAGCVAAEGLGAVRVRVLLSEESGEVVLVGVAEPPAALRDVGRVVGGLWRFGDEDDFFLSGRERTRMPSSW